MNKNILVLLVLTALFINGCGGSRKVEEDTTPNLTAYFTDNVNNTVDVIDVDNMQLLHTLQTGHQDTHSADIVSSDATSTKMYVSNRSDDYIDVLESKTNEITKSIVLNFHPRSIDTQKVTHLAEVASTNKAVAAVIDIDTDEVLATVGYPNITFTNKCGHPYWIDDKHFVFIDRENKKLYTYKIEQINGLWVTNELNVLDTPSPVHHILTPNVNGERNYNATTFYAMAEGDTNNFPAVLKLAFSASSGMSIVETLELKVAGLTASDMGGHHLNFLKDGKTLYAGSKEGHLFVVDYSTSPMTILKTIQVGKGAGHSIEMKDKNLAVVINHSDKFISLINTATNEKITDIIVSELPDSDVGNVQIQAHTQYRFSDDGDYFYMALTEEGAFIKVDLLTHEVTRVDLGGKLTMGSFVKTN